MGCLTRDASRTTFVESDPPRTQPPAITFTNATLRWESPRSESSDSESSNDEEDAVGGDGVALKRKREVKIIFNASSKRGPAGFSDEELGAGRGFVVGDDGESERRMRRRRRRRRQRRRRGLQVRLVLDVSKGGEEEEVRVVEGGDGVRRRSRPPRPSPRPRKAVEGPTSSESEDDDDDDDDGSDGEPFFQNLNLEIERGSFTAIVGSVGSGKSSLLSSILGEMTPLSGRILTTGSIAHCPQQPYLLSQSILDNILFGLDLSPPLLKQTLKATHLEPDLESLPHGLDTQIGDRGITLSGGQRMRVALARAVYADREIYLLDDCLAGLDGVTAEGVFEDALLGALRGRTRVLVTQN
ncbi:Multidrug resistance-associated protein 4, partial [Dinochytrium kinnereticum]